MREFKNNLTSGKSTKNTQGKKGKMFGYQVLGFGSGGGASNFLEATGGTVTTSGNYKIHTFTSPGTFAVSAVGADAANNEVSYVVVAGGGGSGNFGGGGAGGFREYKSGVDDYTASPLNGNPGGTSITVTEADFPITIGNGGNSAPRSGRNPGANSVFSNVTSAGGGGGGTYRGTYNSGGNQSGDPGGSGGGMGSNDAGGSGSVGSGNDPSTTPPQGQPGGPAPGSNNGPSGGGGGATASGGTGQVIMVVLEAQEQQQVFQDLQQHMLAEPAEEELLEAELQREEPEEEGLTITQEQDLELELQIQAAEVHKDQVEQVL